MITKSGKRFAAVLLASTCLAMPVGAWADAGATQAAPAPETARGNVLEEVIVTASRRREESVQTTPIAVTALNADVIARSHATDFSKIGDLVPNLQVNKNVGTAGVSNVYLRGFGDYSNDPAVDPHVATFYDGIYLPAPTGTVFDTFDLGGIEVDAGPQGALVGKNAPIGAIYVTGEKPDGRFDGEVQANYGAYDHYGVHAKVNFPILTDDSGTSILAGHVAYSKKGGGNWIYNEANGKTDMGGERNETFRGALDFTPYSGFEWYVSGVYAHDNSEGHGAHPTNEAGGVAGTSSSATQPTPIPCLLGVASCKLYPYGDTDATFTTRPRSDFVLVSSTLTYRLDPVTLTSVTGYHNFWQVDNEDDGGDPVGGLNAYDDVTRYDEETQEIRISSNKGGGWDFNGHLDWVVGGYFSNFNYHFTNNLHLGALSGFLEPINIVDVREGETGTTQSEALFAHVIYNFTDQWTGTFGVRRSLDQKDHSFQAPGTSFFDPDIPRGFHNTSFEVGTAYQFDDSHLAYVRFAQGYESGGFDGMSHGSGFDPELNNSYEIGFKSDWLDKRLRVNLDFFLNELSNLQVESALQIPVAPFFLQETLNAGSATVEGAEAQIIAVPTENLTTHLNVGYLHPKFNQNNSTTCANPDASGSLLATDCSGLPFALAPKWTINLGGDYVMDLPSEWGTATFSANWTYKSSLYTSDPPYPSSLQNGYGLVDLSVTLLDASEKYSVEFYGTNIFDRAYSVGYANPSGLTFWSTQGRPAEWGIQLGAKF